MSSWSEKASRLVIETRAFINGAYVTAQSGQTFVNINPATEAKLADVVQCGDAEVDAAVKATATVRRGRTSSSKTKVDDSGWSSLRGIDSSKPVAFDEDME